MLNNLQQLERHDYEGRYFMATVVANNDPLMLERVKISIPNLFEGDEASLPWAAPVPKGPVPNSTDGSYGSFGLVPPVGSVLFVILQDGNPKYPLYVGSPIVSGGRPSEANVNYPNRYGFKDPAGNVVFVDTTGGSNTINIQHTSGATVQIADDGSINVTSPADMNFNADGAINMTATGDVTIVGAQIHLNP
jgi:hypothetical protein